MQSITIWRIDGFQGMKRDSSGEMEAFPYTVGEYTVQKIDPPPQGQNPQITSIYHY